MIVFNPLPDDKILDRSNFEQSADDNFKFDENCRKFSKRVENTVGKGEIACFKQFLLSTVFSKGLFPRGIKRCRLGMGLRTEKDCLNIKKACFQDGFYMTLLIVASLTFYHLPTGQKANILR